jgi:hypothetical protein
MFPRTEQSDSHQTACATALAATGVQSVEKPETAMGPTAGAGASPTMDAAAQIVEGLRPQLAACIQPSATQEDASDPVGELQYERDWNKTLQLWALLSVMPWDEVKNGTASEDEKLDILMNTLTQMRLFAPNDKCIVTDLFEDKPKKVDQLLQVLIGKGVAFKERMKNFIANYQIILLDENLEKSWLQSCFQIFHGMSEDEVGWVGLEVNKFNLEDFDAIDIKRAHVTWDQISKDHVFKESHRDCAEALRYHVFQPGIMAARLIPQLNAAEKLTPEIIAEILRSHGLDNNDAWTLRVLETIQLKCEESETQLQSYIFHLSFSISLKEGEAYLYKLSKSFVKYVAEKNTGGSVSLGAIDRAVEAFVADLKLSKEDCSLIGVHLVFSSLAGFKGLGVLSGSEKAEMLRGCFSRCVVQGPKQVERWQDFFKIYIKRFFECEFVNHATADLALEILRWRFEQEIIDDTLIEDILRICLRRVKLNQIRGEDYYGATQSVKEDYRLFLQVKLDRSLEVSGESVTERKRQLRERHPNLLTPFEPITKEASASPEEASAGAGAGGSGTSSSPNRRRRRPKKKPTAPPETDLDLESLVRSMSGEYVRVSVPPSQALIAPGVSRFDVQEEVARSLALTLEQVQERYHEKKLLSRVAHQKPGMPLSRGHLAERETLRADCEFPVEGLFMSREDLAASLTAPLKRFELLSKRLSELGEESFRQAAAFEAIKGDNLKLHKKVERLQTSSERHIQHAEKVQEELRLQVELRELVEDQLRLRRLPADTMDDSFLMCPFTQTYPEVPVHLTRSGAEKFLGVDNDSSPDAIMVLTFDQRALVSNGYAAEHIRPVDPELSARISFRRILDIGPLLDTTIQTGLVGEIGLLLPKYRDCEHHVEVQGILRKFPAILQAPVQIDTVHFNCTRFVQEVQNLLEQVSKLCLHERGISMKDASFKGQVLPMAKSHKAGSLALCAVDGLGDTIGLCRRLKVLQEQGIDSMDLRREAKGDLAKLVQDLEYFTPSSLSTYQDKMAHMLSVQEIFQWATTTLEAARDLLLLVKS